MSKVVHGREVYEKAAELLDYDPETGLFKWKVRASNACKKGWFAGCRDGHGYTLIRIGQSLVKTHRLAWFLSEGSVPDQVDHINGSRSDNRVENLRDCTVSQNLCNRHHLSTRNTSGVTGVYWVKTNKRWAAQIKIKGKSSHLGCFTDKDDAIKARKDAELKYYGEFAPCQ